MPEPALMLPDRHRATQASGLAAGEVGRDHRDLHHLLMEDRHALRCIAGRTAGG